MRRFTYPAAALLVALAIFTVDAADQSRRDVQALEVEPPAVSTSLETCGCGDVCPCVEGGGSPESELAAGFVSGSPLDVAPELVSFAEGTTVCSDGTCYTVPSSSYGATATAAGGTVVRSSYVRRPVLFPRLRSAFRRPLLFPRLRAAYRARSCR